VRILEDLDREFGTVLVGWQGEKRVSAPVQDWLERVFANMARNAGK